MAFYALLNPQSPNSPINWPAIAEGVDTEAELFAVFAKTLGGSFQLPNMFMAQERRVVVPVADNSERGLLLIFANGGTSRSSYLTANTDPLIENSPWLYLDAHARMRFGLVDAMMTGPTNRRAAVGRAAPFEVGGQGVCFGLHPTACGSEWDQTTNGVKFTASTRFIGP